MWQRFTERARRAVFFAQEEAARLGSTNVGPEHLLLGLTREPDSVAGKVLVVLGVRPVAVRATLERRVVREGGNVGNEMQLTSAGRHVIDRAYYEARKLNHEYIGTEHLLLGLMHERESVAAQVLSEFGVDLEQTRAAVSRLSAASLEAGSDTGRGPDLTPDRAEAGGTPAFPGDGGLPRRRRGGRSAVQALGELHETIRRSSGRPDQLDDAAARDLTALLWRVSHEGISAAGPGLTPAEIAGTAAIAARLACAGLTDLRGICDLNVTRAWALLSLARILKQTLALDPQAHERILPRRTLAMLFEKPSLRTRVSFEAGLSQMGGYAIHLPPGEIAMGLREPVKDVARVLSGMVDGILARVFAHATVLELAEYSSVPVINGLCDREHPCQALADLLTLWEQRGRISGQVIAYVGDGNNTAHSLLWLAARLGAVVRVASPEGYEPLPEIVAAAQADGAATGGSVQVLRDPHEACRGADVVYTDTWASMGQEAEAEARAAAFRPYQVNADLTAAARRDHLFMHCLPAHRGEEVTNDVIEGPHSVVFEEAANRLHAQKAIMAVLL